MIGKTISHYRVLEKLGEGGMGIVYKAEDTRLERTVALKSLSPFAVESEEEKTRFVHEAQAAADLDDSHICSVYAIDEVEGQIFIVMARVEGQSLKEAIEYAPLIPPRGGTQGGVSPSRGELDGGVGSPLPLGKVLGIAIQIAEGLQAAHEKGIVHRDLKPANVMLTSDGVVKIVDFGLAKLAGRTKVTKTGTTLGTVAYMSPEQARREEVDHRTDIWSLGVW